MDRAHRPARSLRHAAALLLALAGFASTGPMATAAEPAPTPGCVFTGGAFTCGGAVPPDVDPAPSAPDDPPKQEPSEPPAPPAIPQPSPSSPRATASPAPSETTQSPGAAGDEDAPAWIPVTVGVAAIAAAAAVTLYVAARRRSGEDDASL